MYYKITKNIYVDYLPTTYIESVAVDCAHYRRSETGNGTQGTEMDGIFFLSENNVLGPLPDHIDRVYTSPHIGILLRTQSGVAEDKITCLPLNQPLLIRDQKKGLNFSVTLIDSMQNPGSVMYLFENDDFGSILYAGKCAYSSNFLKPPLSSFIGQPKKLDCLYVHRPALVNDAVSPSAAVRQTAQYIRSNPMRNIFIYEPCYRDDILLKLRQKLQKKICVSENIMRHLETIGSSSDFTLDQNGVRIFITDTPKVKRLSRNEKDLKVVLIPRSVKRTSEEIQCKKEKLENYGFKVIIYTEHCTISELRTMVNALDPKRTVLIGPTKPTWSFIGDISSFMDMSIEASSRTLRSVKDYCLDGIENENTESPLSDKNENLTPSMDDDSDSVISQHTVINPLIEIH